MSKVKLLLLLLIPMVLAGCATTTISNLTPGRQVRKENGQYPFEVELRTRQQTLVKDSIKAYVVVGLDQYPMQRVQMLTNRWETLVPIPAGTDVVTYRYRFDYEYRAIPARQFENKQSRYYQLSIVNK